MKNNNVYLIAKKGHRTAFKITCAHVVSNIEFMFIDAIKEYRDCKNKYITDTYTLHNYIKLIGKNGWNIYITELDDIENNAKKIRDKDWLKLVDKFIEDNKIEDVKRSSDKEIIDIILDRFNLDKNEYIEITEGKK